MNIGSRDDQPQGSQPWSDQRITAFVLGELDAEEAARFEQEIGDKPALASAVEEARQLTAQLRSWYAAEPSPQMDAPRRQSLLGAMAQATAHRPPQLPPTPQVTPKPQTTPAAAAPGAPQRHSPRVRWLALAATLLVAIGGLAYQLRDAAQDARPIALAPREPAGDAALSRPGGDDAAASAPAAEPLRSQGAEPLQSRRAAPQRGDEDMAPLTAERLQSDSVASEAAPDQRIAEGQALDESPRMFRAAPPQAAAMAASRSPENPFQAVSEQPHSRIPTDVDPAAAATVQAALAQGRLPRPEEVRIESLINALSGVAEAEPRLPAAIEIGPCPWRPEHRLARIAIADPGERELDFHVVFNPARVAAYRLIGFEDRSPETPSLADASQPSSAAQAAAAPERASARGRSAPEGRSVPEDGARDSDQPHRARQVIVLYQWVPQQPRSSVPVPDSAPADDSPQSDHVLTVQLRRLSNEATVLAEFPATDPGTDLFGQRSVPYRSTALVAALGLQLRQSESRGDWTLQDVLQEARQLAAELETPPAWLELVQTAAALQADPSPGQQR